MKDTIYSLTSITQIDVCRIDTYVRLMGWGSTGIFEYTPTKPHKYPKNKKRPIGENVKYDGFKRNALINDK